MQQTLSRAATAYLATQVQSRSPLELVVMLYDGAIRFMTQAAEAMARRDLVTKAQALSRATAILAELQNQLDMDQGGAVAASLDELYTYILARLVDANLSGDPTPIAEGLRLMTTLRDAWATIADQSQVAA